MELQQNNQVMASPRDAAQRLSQDGRANAIGGSRLSPRNAAAAAVQQFQQPQYGAGAPNAMPGRPPRPEQCMGPSGQSNY